MNPRFKASALCAIAIAAFGMNSCDSSTGSGGGGTPNTPGSSLVVGQDNPVSVTAGQETTISFVADPLSGYQVSITGNFATSLKILDSDGRRLDSSSGSKGCPSETHPSPPDSTRSS